MKQDKRKSAKNVKTEKSFDDNSDKVPLNKKDVANEKIDADFVNTDSEHNGYDWKSLIVLVSILLVVSSIWFLVLISKCSIS